MRAHLPVRGAVQPEPCPSWITFSKTSSNAFSKFTTMNRELRTQYLRA